MDSSPKTFKEGRPPKAGDLLKYDVDKGDWIPVTAADVLADATGIGEYTLPAEDGADGDVLTTNGAGVLSWTTP